MGRRWFHNTVPCVSWYVDQLVSRPRNGSNIDHNSAIWQFIYCVHGLLYQLRCFTLLENGLVGHPPLVLVHQLDVASTKLTLNVTQSGNPQILLVFPPRRCAASSTPGRVAKLRHFTRGPIDVHSTGMVMAIFSPAMPSPHAPSDPYRVLFTRIILNCWWLFFPDLLCCRQ